MNNNLQNSLTEIGVAPSAAKTGEETLRLIARLPAPEGLERRILAGVLARRHEGRVLAWPAAFQPQSGWMRTAAAAAIVFVVAGGGWGVYSRVQPGPARVVSMPSHIQAPGSFSGASAVRTPQTLDAPVLVKPAKPAPLQGKQSKKLRSTPHAVPPVSQPSGAKIITQPAISK